MTHRAPESTPPTPRRWVLATLPLALVALLAYAAFEWIFFVTKPSPVSILPWIEQIRVLLTAPLPLTASFLVVQVAATGSSLLFWPRLRTIAAVPSATILAALSLILVDNFLYAVVQMSVLRSDLIGRIAYGLVLAGTFAVWLRKLHGELPGIAARRNSLVALWVVAGPMLLAALVYPWVNRAVQPPLESAIPRPPNVLLLSIDGVDADRLSAYGYAGRTSPFLASIADETFFCENAFSNAIETYTSQTSFLTGKRPFTTNVIVPPAILRGDDAVQHLPALLRRAGYKSMQLSLRHIADAEDVNMQRGFDLTNYRWENRLSTSAVEGTYDTARPFRLAALDRLHARLSALAGAELRSDQFAHVTGDEVNPYWSDERRIETLDWFIARTSDPWFAQVHLLDTHVGHHERDVTAAGTDDRYDALLQRADDHVRRVFEMLKRRGVLDDTVIVITTDHGSSERFAHVPRIPLMIRFPGAAHARRETRNVQLLDIAPTVLDAVGLTIPEWMEGASLIGPGVDARRTILASGPVATLRPRGMLRIALPGPPDHGAAAAQAVIGSWWYSLDLRDGGIKTGQVRGHTRPTNQTSPAQAREIIGGMLGESGNRAP